MKQKTINTTLTDTYKTLSYLSPKNRAILKTNRKTPIKSVFETTKTAF
ncbi:hypothetical protein HMPREF9713_00103 [Myroides odoratimimus CCUG 12700]|nr:hypothetical protein HMPREF9711_01484 [Myroides odoratimimus CCUG 3837]EPH13909.1 hypothetical protein HMPREF9713_00103 [Myroides odoratimimus CCUG 12700]